MSVGCNDTIKFLSVAVSECIAKNKELDQNWFKVFKPPFTVKMFTINNLCMLPCKSLYPLEQKDLILEYIYIFNILYMLLT